MSKSSSCYTDTIVGIILTTYKLKQIMSHENPINTHLIIRKTISFSFYFYILGVLKINTRRE